jgi:antitoxin (DNA-binding transcriptional repressor) of toxin-antitoxin stability system
MQTFEAAEAGESFVKLLDDVRRGQTVLIELDGRPVARLSPERPFALDDEVEQRKVEEAMASILEIRKRTKPVSIEELLASRDEGRR